MGADHCKDRYREGDIGGGGNGPAVQCAVPGAPVDQDEHQRWHRHAADRSRDRECSAVRIAEVAGDEFAFEFEADDEEEHCQQPVCRPDRQRQVQVQCSRADGNLAQRVVRLGPGGVLAQISASAAARSSKIPPTVSLRRIVVMRRASGHDPGESRGGRRENGVVIGGALPGDPNPQAPEAAEVGDGEPPWRRFLYLRTPLPAPKTLHRDMGAGRRSRVGGVWLRAETVGSRRACRARWCPRRWCTRLFLRDDGSLRSRVPIGEHACQGTRVRAPVDWGIRGPARKLGGRVCMLSLLSACLLRRLVASPPKCSACVFSRHDVAVRIVRLAFTNRVDMSGIDKRIHVPGGVELPQSAQNP